MKMKSMAAILGLSLGMSTGALRATEMTKSDVDTTISMARSILQTDRQAIVAKNMTLTDKESEPFWNLYREYKAEQQKVRDQYVTLVKTYAEKYGTINDKEAKGMMKDYFAWERDETDLKSKWAKKFAKVLPETKVMRFFQIENKIDSVIKFEMAKAVPLTE